MRVRKAALAAMLAATMVAGVGGSAFAITDGSGTSGSGTSGGAGGVSKKGKAGGSQAQGTIGGCGGGQPCDAAP